MICIRVYNIIIFAHTYRKQFQLLLHNIIPNPKVYNANVDAVKRQNNNVVGIYIISYRTSAA